MASVHIICSLTQVNSRGKSPVYYRLTHEGRYKLIATRIYVDSKKEWNKKEGMVKGNYPNSLRANLYLQNILNKVQRLAIKINKGEVLFSQIDLKDFIYDKPKLDFFLKRSCFKINI